jgi:hypothetical protein
MTLLPLLPLLLLPLLLPLLLLLLLPLLLLLLLLHAAAALLRYTCVRRDTCTGTNFPGIDPINNYMVSRYGTRTVCKLVVWLQKSLCHATWDSDDMIIFSIIIISTISTIIIMNSIILYTRTGDG